MGYAPQERKEVQQEGCLSSIEARQVHLSQTVQHGVQVRTGHPAHLTLTPELTAGGHLAAEHEQCHTQAQGRGDAWEYAACFIKQSLSTPAAMASLHSMHLCTHL